MTDATALRELLEKVEVGGYLPSINLRFLGGSSLESSLLSSYAHAAYTGSLDAAIALLEAILPGWQWSSAVDAHDERWFVVGDGGVYETDEVYGDHPDSALLLIAILKAKIAETEADT